LKVSNRLSLASLKEGMAGMEPALGESCSHAAGVCLEYEKHIPGKTTLSIDGTCDVVYSLTWDPVTEQMSRSWSDLQGATEWGASGLAAVIVQDLFGYQILQRSWKGTGFDYWIGNSNDNEPMFQNKARLEVTGILHGSERDISTRLKEKQYRFAEYPHELPAIVVVVEFGTPRSRIAEE
jgi:hypothetical protein